MVRRFTTTGAALSALLLTTTLAAVPAQAVGFVAISGAGSTWAQNAVEQWREDVQPLGLSVNYAGTGSTIGRNWFRNGTTDFAVTEIPYGLTDEGVTDPLPSRGFAYVPYVAGGTGFMYNLTIAGKRVTSLRLSGDTIAKIFTRDITSWDDLQIKSENPGLTMPATPIVPVVRGDSAGDTALFTGWLASQHAELWDAHCVAAGRPLTDGHCGQTSSYPVGSVSGFVQQAGALGVSGYVSQDTSDGHITYVQSSYALNTGFPVAKVLNEAGYYVGPTASNVGVALLDAQVRTSVPTTDPTYLTADLTPVYTSIDPRSYPLSAYSYLVVPTAEEGSFTAAKGSSLSTFAYYSVCTGQQRAATFGYSALPANLVTAGIDQITQIPGADAAALTVAACGNPTLTAGEDTLKATAPMPKACDFDGPLQCGTAKSAVPAPSFSSPSGRFGLGSVTFSWSGLAAYGMSGYQFRTRSATLAGSWITGLSGATSGRSRTVTPRAGATVCLSVRGYDELGNAGAWSAYRCQSRAADDRALSGSGWSRTTRDGAYLGSVTRTTTPGRSLSVTAVGSRFALVATTCSSCGKVRVYDGTRIVTTVNLASSTTHLRTVIALPALASGTHTIRLVVATSGKRVEVDGFAASRA